MRALTFLRSRETEQVESVWRTAAILFLIIFRAGVMRKLSSMSSIMRMNFVMGAANVGVPAGT